jgi:predicted nucleic acid-binding protein
MKIVADTSVFLAVVLHEANRPRIIALTRGHQLVAPEILPYEIGNALSALKKRGILDARQIREAWRSSQAIEVSLHRSNVDEALDIAAELSIYAYDAYFLECALALRASLLTLDKSMNRHARRLGIAIVE